MRYSVRRYFNGHHVSDASNHRQQTAAVKAARKLNKGMSEGWFAQVHDNKLDTGIADCG